jgi:hypothetical protein
MSSETSAPYVGDDAKVRVPLRTFGWLAAVVAAGAIAWATTKAEVADHTERIKAIEVRAALDHDILLEIRSDVKAFNRERK